VLLTLRTPVIACATIKRRADGPPRMDATHTTCSATTQSRLVDAVLEANPTADRAWLLCFAVAELESYLERLCRTADSGPDSLCWERVADTPAIVYRSAA
jgi:hypothetical protein